MFVSGSVKSKKGRVVFAEGVLVLMDRLLLPIMEE